MSRKKQVPSVPSYRLHKQSGLAVVTLNGHDHLLGPYRTKASKKKYDRLISRWTAGGRQPLKRTDNDDDGPIVAEVIAQYWAREVAPRFEPEGKRTKQSDVIGASLRPLLALYEDTPACQFTAGDLRIVRQSMVDAGLARTTINRRVKYIVGAFCWLASVDAIPVTTWYRLRTIKALRHGQTTAREPAPVMPVEDTHVDKVLPFLPQVVRDMVELQRITGARPGEICKLRPCDIDRSSDVWVFRPSSHKCSHLGKERRIYVGPRGQVILLRYLARDPESFCFQPRDSESKRRTERTAARRVPLSCGNVVGSNRVRRRKRPPSDRYVTMTYARAISRACDFAHPLPAHLQRRRGETSASWTRRLTEAERAERAAHYKAYRFAPNRLRHSAATSIRKEFGLEASAIMLGHSSAQITDAIYARRDETLAIQVARKLG